MEYPISRSLLLRPLYPCHQVYLKTRNQPLCKSYRIIKKAYANLKIFRYLHISSQLCALAISFLSINKRRKGCCYHNCSENLPTGIEPVAFRIVSRCSTNELWEIFSFWEGLLTVIFNLLWGRVYNGKLSVAPLFAVSCGSRIWTDDLRAMTPTSCQTALSRDIF